MAGDIRSILAVTSPPADAEPTLGWAERLAETFDAVLDAAFVREDWSAATAMTPYSYALSPVMMDQLEAEVIKAEKEARAVFDARANATTLRYRRFLAVASSEDRGLNAASRSADLAVALRPDAQDPARAREAYIGGMALEGGATVFACPPEADPVGAFPHVALAWDGGREAARAMREARPFFARAEQVTVLMLDRADVEEPMLMEAEAYLSAHGVKPRMVMVPDSSGREGPQLLEHAVSIQSDLLVMGAYGRARWREQMFGGVTQYALFHAPMPLLMTH